MKIERLEKYIRYTADNGKWLTSKTVKEGKEHLRSFSQMIYAPKEMDLIEMTEAEMNAWKKAHPAPKPEKR